MLLIVSTGHVPHSFSHSGCSEMPSETSGRQEPSLLKLQTPQSLPVGAHLAGFYRPQQSSRRDTPNVYLLSLITHTPTDDRKNLYHVADRHRQRYARYHDFGYIRENLTSVAHDFFSFKQANKKCAFDLTRQLGNGDSWMWLKVRKEGNSWTATVERRLSIGWWHHHHKPVCSPGLAHVTSLPWLMSNSLGLCDIQAVDIGERTRGKLAVVPRR